MSAMCRAPEAQGRSLKLCPKTPWRQTSGQLLTQALEWVGTQEDEGPSDSHSNKAQPHICLRNGQVWPKSGGWREIQLWLQRDK